MKIEAPEKAEARYSVPALEKGMRILEDVARSARPLSLVEIAKQQGRNRNEVYRMVSCLESMGYLTREADSKRFGLSLKIFQMANSHPPTLQLRSVIEPILRELALAIGESCHACIPNGNDISVLAQATGNERIRISFQLGARFDPLETCSGKLILSEMSEEERGDVLRHSGLWNELGEQDKELMRKKLGVPRPDRLWEEASSLRAGVRDIAVAIGSADTILATIAVAHLADRPKAEAPETIIRHLKFSARKIEAQIGLHTTTEDTILH